MRGPTGRASDAGGEPRFRKAIRGTFAACCASTASGRARTTAHASEDRATVYRRVLSPAVRDSRVIFLYAAGREAARARVFANLLSHSFLLDSLCRVTWSRGSSPRQEPAQRAARGRCCVNRPDRIKNHLHLRITRPGSFPPARKSGDRVVSI